MIIKIEARETEDKNNIIVASDDESCKYFFFSIAQILKSLIARNRSSLISNISSAVISNQIKNFYYKLKAERELSFPFSFKGKSGKVILRLHETKNVQVEIIEDKKKE